MTYAESGVDIEREEQAIKGLLSSIKSRTWWALCRNDRIW